MTGDNGAARKRVERIHPLSPLQRGMVFHTMLESETNTYVEQVAFRLQGALDVAAFRSAWREVVARHEILRTSIHWTEQAKSRQVVHRQGTLPWTEHDWRALPADEQAAKLDALSREDWVKGFDLARLPLFRLTLIRLGEDTHQVIWTNHHAILDGWSRAAVFREVLALYRAACSGRPASLPPARSFGDYIAWIGRQDPARAEGFWRTTLAGFTTPTRLPASSESVATAAERSATVDFTLSAADSAALRALSRGHGVTLGTIAQAAWGLLLSRHAGTDDVVFGVTVSGRPPELTGVESMVGLFINTLPVRIQIDPDRNISDWLQDLQKTIGQLREHEHTDLAEIQTWSEIPRGEPLFDSLVVFENYPIDGGDDATSGDVTVGEVRIREQTHYPLTLVVVPGERIGVRLLYATDRYDHAGASALLDQLCVLLHGMTQASSTVDELDLLTAEQQENLTTTPTVDVPAGPVLVERFAEWARSSPDRVAVVSGDAQVTYGAVLTRASRLAAHLVASGVGADSVVGVFLDRSVEQIVAVLAVQLAGGAYLPIDTGYPPERVEYLLEDSGARVLITDRDTTSAGVVVPPSAEGGVLPEVRVSADQLGYVIYTSGSTGNPKGVLVTHRQAARLFDATRDWFNFDPDDVWTLFHSIAFDFSVWELWGALAHGGRLILVDEDTRRSPAEMAVLLGEQAVTVLNQTPSAFFPLSHTILTEDRAIPGLRAVIFGGEALPVEQLADWVHHFGDQHPQLVNMYGITETTVHVTHRPLTTRDVIPGAGSVIGRPIPDLQVHLLDRRLRPVPPGVVGELYV
ncbi:AMP-binding protein, partial [Amycolatopsis rhizosphaerae]